MDCCQVYIFQIVLAFFFLFTSVIISLVTLLVTHVQSRFEISEFHLKNTIACMGKSWREHKSRISKEILSNGPQQIPLKPNNVKSEIEWREFVRSRFSEENMVN